MDACLSTAANTVADPADYAKGEEALQLVQERRAAVVVQVEDPAPRTRFLHVAFPREVQLVVQVTDEKGRMAHPGGKPGLPKFRARPILWC